MQSLLFCIYLATSWAIKLEKKSQHPHQTKKKFLESQDVINAEDSIELMLQKQENFYLAQIQVGTPPQNFSVLIDTGSPNLVLTSTLCRQESCHKHGSYNPQLSSTAYYIEAIKLANGEIGNEIDIQFATGSVEGVFFEDTVCLSSFCVEDQLIIGIVQETEDIFAQMKFDGILGLGRIQEAVVSNASFIQNIQIDGQNKATNFSIFLSPDESDQPSEIVIGGISSHLLYPGEQFTFFSVTTQHLWSIKLTAIFLGKQRIDNCDIIPCQGLIDTGTSFISFSQYPMDIFNHKFGQYQSCSDIESFPNLTFVFEGDVSFTLTGPQYFRRNTHAFFSQDICIPFVKQSPVLSEDEQIFVLGQPFLVRHYVWFDEEKDRIGIVKSKQ